MADPGLKRTELANIPVLRSRTTLAIFSCVLAGMAFGLVRRTTVQCLQAYLGKDLRTLSEDEQLKFDDLIGRLAPNARTALYPKPPRTLSLKEWHDYFKSKPTIFPPFTGRQSWYLWRIANAKGAYRLVLFQGMPLWMIPSASSARIFVFDIHGNVLTDCAFPTGWRIDIEDARWVKHRGLTFPCLRISSSASIIGADIAFQYYAFLGDTFALIRLEDSAGHFVTVNYQHPNHTIGPEVPCRTPEQWEASLQSSDQGEVLRGLVWLGGFHSDPPVYDTTVYAERPEDATRAQVTRARWGVRSAVQALTHSENPWIQEAARHAVGTMFAADGQRPRGKP